MRSPLLLLSLLVTSFPLTSTSGRAQELLVSGFNSNQVHRYDLDSGADLGPLDGMPNPHGICYGPDGRLYVVSEGENSVRRYDPDSLQFLDEFIVDDPGTGGDDTGGLNAPTGVVFGPDGNCYVASFLSDEVKRYDPAGAYLGDFVTAGSGGLNGPDAGIGFGPDGHFYVPSYFTNQILRYDGASGAFRDVFVAAGAGGLARPRTLRWRSDGLLYVSSETSNAVLRYDLDGQFVDAFVSLIRPSGFAIHPASGNVYVTSVTRNNVRRFDGTTGALIDTVVPSGRGGLDASVFLAFRPDPDLELTRPSPGSAGSNNQIEIHHAVPSRPLLFVLGTQAGSALVDPRRHAYLGIADARFRVVHSDAAGDVVLSGLVDPAFTGVTLLFQAMELAPTRVSNLVVQTF